MVEQAFVTSLIKSDGGILPFFEQPVSAVLAASMIAAFASPAFVWVRRKLTGMSQAAAPQGSGLL
jgi:putative tricarboxylic transport membrane protein